MTLHTRLFAICFLVAFAWLIPPTNAEEVSATSKLTADLNRNFSGKTFFYFPKDPEEQDFIIRGVSLSLDADGNLVKLVSLCESPDGYGPEADFPGSPRRMTKDSVSDCDKRVNGLKWIPAVERAPLRLIQANTIQVTNIGNEHDLVRWNYESLGAPKRVGFTAIPCSGAAECRESAANLKALVQIATGQTATEAQHEPAARESKPSSPSESADRPASARNFRHEPEGRIPEAASEPGAEEGNLACRKIIGTWHWFDNGTVIVKQDQTAAWYAPITNVAGHTASWKCDPRTQAMTLSWSNGFTDTMRAVADGQNLQGKNNRGMTLWAQRRPDLPQNAVPQAPFDPSAAPWPSWQPPK